ncbi:MAG: hypothetical protein ACP5H2_12655 [Solirubrobacteraceae bacterium]
MTTDADNRDIVSARDGDEIASGRSATHAGEDLSLNVRRRIVVSVRVATTHPIEAYGGFQLLESGLQELANGLKEGVLPMTVNHDVASDLRAVCLKTEIVSLSDGFKALDAQLAVDAEPWEGHQEELSRLGVAGGMSYSLTANIGEFPREDLDQASAPRLRLVADASHFSADELIRSGQHLAAVGPTRVGYIYQFSAVHTCRVIIEFVQASGGVRPAALAAQAGVELFVAGALATVKALFAARRTKSADMTEPMTLEVHRTWDVNGGVTEAFKLTAQNEDAFERGLRALEPMLSAEPEKRVALWDDIAREWTA